LAGGGRGGRRIDREAAWHFRLFEDNFVPMVTYDPESLRLLAVNRAALRQYGFTRQEAASLTLADIRMPEDEAEDALIRADRARVRELSEGILHLGVQRHVRKDGTRILMNVNVQAIQFGGRKAMLASAEDVTERVESERVLRESEARLQEGEQRLAALLRNLPGMAYRCRLDQNWTVLYVSEGALALTGYEPGDFIGNAIVSYGDLIHPEDRDRVYDEALAAVREGRQYELEYRIRTRTGEERRVWERGQFFPDDREGRLEGFVMDMTERKLAEGERERLLAAIEQMAEMMLITDARGAIQYVNPAFERVTGFTRAEVLGKNPRILKSGVQSAEFYREMWATLKSGKTWRGRFVNKRKDGTRFTEDALISPVFGPGGDIVNYVGVKNDITGQIILEEQFRQSQKMEAVGRLAGGIAHDFNNMLTVILLRSELARKRLAPDDPLHASFAEIHDAAERSASLTRQLLTYARRQAVEPRVLALNEAVRGMLQMLRRLMGENIELAWRPADDLWAVKADPAQLDQLLANLCVNARDAIADVGKVTIETSNVVLDQEYCRKRPGHTPGEYVRLAVSDNGVGMDKATLSHLFEPFFTTKEVGKGTGLGLATVYGIVKQSEGFIDVYSEPGDGTTFQIYLPRHAEAAVHSAPASEQDAPRGRGETILLIEDEPLILEVTADILRDLGYRVLVAARPDAALALAAKHPEPIHLVLTDVVMPEMNGRDLVQRLLADRAGMKSLYMSGYTANVMLHRGLAGEGDAFIQKPFLPRQLAVKVREVLDRAG
jgi:two-component system cell cycle sensor histidine kinase/response regulator CckA